MEYKEKISKLAELECNTNEESEILDCTKEIEDFIKEIMPKEDNE